MIARMLMVFGLLALCTAAVAEPLPAHIQVASEEWSDYTNADGSGLAWDILRKVFEPAGVKLETRSTPYMRSVGLVQRGEADAWVGSYHDEIANTLYPRWHYDTDHIYALGLADKPAPTLNTIGHFRLAWVRGYGFERYLPGIHQFNEVQRRTGILPMLLHDRADYYIDAQTEILGVLKQADQPGRFKLTHIAELPLFLGFADTPNGRALLALFDRRMDQLVPSGELRPLFDRWQQPYPFTP
ncbi:transporter substrate-binding domain-containing protein [Pseudomonas sp. App30]|uniref:substrate-binding periplasmic protein n=1 Tax=Pseudomonas sp. App30 TaxID=3068990 RepID=UPI003A7FD267